MMGNIGWTDEGQRLYGLPAALATIMKCVKHEYSTSLMAREEIDY